MDDLKKLFQPIDVGGIGFQPVREEPGGEQVANRVVLARRQCRMADAFSIPPSLDLPLCESAVTPLRNSIDAAEQT